MKSDSGTVLRHRGGAKSDAQSHRRTAQPCRFNGNMSALIQDLRIAVRGYLMNPLFTAVVVTILALAIGANSAIFTVVNAVLLRPLPYPHASSLVGAFQVNRDAQRRPLSPPNYFDLKEQTRAFSG